MALGQPGKRVTDTLGRRHLVGFDLETTSSEAADARIVSAALTPPSGHPHTWLADPGVPIPRDASAVHGITTDQARYYGRPARDVVWEVFTHLSQQWSGGAVVVIYNAQYDLAVLEAEMRRHHLGTLDVGLVVDPLVLWRQAERYRKGKKRLDDAVIRFGVRRDNAHNAVDDAAAAVDVLRAMAGLVPWTAWTPYQAMSTQQAWHRDWAEGFSSWLSSVGGDASGVDPAWPLPGQRIAVR